MKWVKKQNTNTFLNPGVITSLKHLRQTPFFSYLTLCTSKRLGAKKKFG